MLKPFSNHWADLAAHRVVLSRGEKPQMVVASGITPSGMVHVGNFREVITVDLVARALRKLGKSVRFIYSWDNFDTFRKVPKNLPDPKGFEPYLFQPIARIPDPWGQSSSYAQGRIELFEKELRAVGIHPEFLYQESRYGSGMYAKEIRHVLEHAPKVREILNAHRTSPLPEDWIPTAIYCEKCSRDEMDSEHYEGEWAYSYSCKSCGHKATVDIRHTPNLKLVWRLDWPMRWHYEQVDFEPGGKDHSSQGGSFDTGKQLITALWGEKAPEYLQYDFVMIKGGAGKMSSSSGELYTLAQVLEVYEPEIVRWIFSNQRPNHDFALAFDEDVIRMYDEFDKSEAFAFEAEPEDPKTRPKWWLNRRTYELARTEDAPVSGPAPMRAGFRQLCGRLQICGLDIPRTFERYYQASFAGDDNRHKFVERARRAIHWLQTYAPEEYCYTLNTEPKHVELTEVQQKAVLALRDLISRTDLDTIEAKALNDEIWKVCIHEIECDSKQAFTAIYQKLIGRDQGPRLPGFLKEIDSERLLALLQLGT